MTEELSALLFTLTCPRCNGGGILAWRFDAQLPGAATARRSNAIPCDVCGGNGINPTIQPHPAPKETA